MEDIPLARTTISEAAIEAIARTIRSGWPGPGREVTEFEREFAAAVRASAAVAVSSGTAALHLAVTLLGMPPGSEVITTANTFVATNHVLLHAGLVPVFADIERFTGNIDVESIERLITDATRAIMVVHYAGYPCDLDALYAVAGAHDLAVVEDCAHACGATYHGRPIGGTDGFCAFSFQATKNLTTVDGGALCFGDDSLARRARRLRWLGIDRDTHERQTNDGYEWEYDVDEVGFRYTMSDVNAAMGRVGLTELAAGNARRTAIAARYRDGLRSIAGIEPLRYDPRRASSYYLFPVLVERRDELLTHLRGHGIGAGVHYKANDRYRVYDPADLPETHWFADHALSLPMHLGLTDHDVDRVLETLNGF